MPGHEKFFAIDHVGATIHDTDARHQRQRTRKLPAAEDSNLARFIAEIRRVALLPPIFLDSGCCRLFTPRRRTTAAGGVVPAQAQ